MYQCGRCGLTRASGQEIGVIQKCKCPWEFVPPASPQRTWVGLKDEEIGEIAVKSQDGISPHDDTLRFAQAIEAALRSKNT